MGRQSWGLLPEIANNSSTITKDTLPPMYSQLFDDGVQKRIFMNVNDTIVSYAADGSAPSNIALPNQAKGGISYYDGTQWTGTPSGTSTQFFKGGYPPAWGTVGGLTQVNDTDTGTVFSDETEVTFLSVAKTITSGNTVFVIATGYNVGVAQPATIILKQGSTAVQTIIAGSTPSDFKYGWSVSGIVTGLSGAITFSVTAQIVGYGSVGNCTAYGNLTVLEF